MPICVSNSIQRAVFFGLCGGLLTVGCSGDDKAKPLPDLRPAVEVTKAERAIIGEVMRRNLVAINQISQAAGQGDIRSVALLAQQASKAPGPGALDRQLREKLPAGWRELGKGVDEGFRQISQAAQMGGSPLLINQGMASVTQACVACHTSYRIEVGSK